MEQKKVLAELYTNAKLETEKHFIHEDNERMKEEAEQQKSRKLGMATQLRDELLNQLKEKQIRRELEKGEDKQFQFMFPYELGLERPFVSKVNTFTNRSQHKAQAKTLSIDLHKELPMQFDIQAPQYAHRIIKDYQREDTIQNANQRLKKNLEKLKM